MAKEILTTEYKRFDEFAKIMSSMNDCDNTHNFTLAALASMNFIDNEIDELKSLDWLKANGGRCCDCEIIYNIILPYKENKIPFYGGRVENMKVNN